MYDFKQIHCTISQNNSMIRDWLNDPMNSLFGLKAFDPALLLCLLIPNLVKSCAYPIRICVASLI